MAKIAVPEQYWSRSMESPLAALESTPYGLDSVDAQKRRETFGPNLLAVKKRATALGLFRNQFKSPIILILPYSPLSGLLGFTPLSLPPLLAL